MVLEGNKLAFDAKHAEVPGDRARGTSVAP